ncbi:MAG: nicotinate-nucleotide adenylyltransferase [Cyanobacteria bacterium REEB459]|nr:nicotinate-nucleotide adenylyltransferase [Cyanobacteria bacterium REEB459]
MTCIALFGTSADPPHRGHAAVVTWLARQFDYVAVWAAENPFKTGQTPLAQRFRMLELMLGELPLPAGKVGLHPEFSHRRSLVSIHRAQQRWPGTQLVLVVGSDLVTQLPSWYRAEEIFAAVNILVFPRPGYPLAPEALATLERYTQVEVAEIAERVEAASSSYRLAHGHEELTPSVQAYISEHQLYQPAPHPPL